MYNESISFEENRANFMHHQWPIPPYSIASAIKATFLGFPIASRIGVAACPLTSSAASVQACWEWGFSVVTYKTIRSSKKQAHCAPNIASLVYKKLVTACDVGGTMYATRSFSHDARTLSVANSIGNASDDIEKEMEQIALARDAAKPGNVLIVSIYGSYDNGIRTLKDDFLYVALCAKKAGAHIVEANFSCPNVAGGMLYQDPARFFQIAEALVQALGETPLLVKVGFLDDNAALHDMLIAAARAGVAGITAINTVPMRIVDSAGNPYFGDRPVAGVSGAPIALLAQNFVRGARLIIKKEKLSLVLCGVGGITMPDQFHAMHEAGADIALSATGVMWNLGLGYEYHQKYGAIQDIKTHVQQENKNVLL